MTVVLMLQVLKNAKLKQQLKQNFEPQQVGEDTVNSEAMGSFLTSLIENSPKSVIFTGLPNKSLPSLKVRNGSKIRNRYNHVPHLNQDTNWKVTTHS